MKTERNKADGDYRRLITGMRAYGTAYNRGSETEDAVMNGIARIRYRATMGHSAAKRAAGAIAVAASVMAIAAIPGLSGTWADTGPETPCISSRTIDARHEEPRLYTAYKDSEARRRYIDMLKRDLQQKHIKYHHK